MVSGPLTMEMGDGLIKKGANWLLSVYFIEIGVTHHPYVFAFVVKAAF